MADITDPQAVKFVNERVRVAANKLATAYLQAVAHLAAWQSVQSLIPNDSSPVVDGRQAEGVGQITGSDVNTIVALVSGVKSQLEANSNALRDIVFKVSISKGE